MSGKYTGMEMPAEEIFRRKEAEETKRKNELAKLRMENDLPAKGFVYLCAVMDLCGRKVLSRRVGNDMTAEPATDAVRDAATKEKVTDGLAPLVNTSASAATGESG